jgi:putative transcriptional regulator
MGRIFHILCFTWSQIDGILNSRSRKQRQKRGKKLKREWLKELRKDRNLTGRAAAAEIGISHNYLFEIENGVRNPSGKLALKIATYYGFDMSRFFMDQLPQSKAL